MPMRSVKESPLKIIEHTNFDNKNESVDVKHNLIDDTFKIKFKSKAHTKLSTSQNSLSTPISPSNTSANIKLRSVSPNIFKSKTSLPSKDTVLRKMKKITRSIQELYKATKEVKTEL
jgi:hypothetical protein